MPNFKRKVEQAIGAFKYDNQTWREVFTEVNADGAIDHKALTNVIICILEELDDRQEETPVLREAKKSIPSGTSGTKEKTSD